MACLPSLTPSQKEEEEEEEGGREELTAIAALLPSPRIYSIISCLRAHITRMPGIPPACTIFTCHHSTRYLCQRERSVSRATAIAPAYAAGSRLCDICLHALRRTVYGAFVLRRRYLAADA